jgi:hypothetical protein
MNELLRKLHTLCETGTAEAEGDFLSEVFVPFDTYAEVLSVPSRAPRLMVGKKGSGKSSLLRNLALSCERDEVSSPQNEGHLNV